MICSRCWLDITLVHLFTSTHSPVLSPSIKYHTHTHTISHLAVPYTHKTSHLVILPTLIITNNTMPSRKDTSKMMPTKKVPRKETGQLPKKSSTAAKRDPAVTVPSPPPKKGSNNKISLFFLALSAIFKSHPKSLLQSNKYRDNCGGNNFSSIFPTSSDKTLVKEGRSETNQCSAR